MSENRELLADDSDSVPAGKCVRDARKSEDYQGQTLDAEGSGEGDYRGTEGVHGVHQKQPEQGHGAGSTLSAEI